MRADVTKWTKVCEARFEGGISASYGHVVAALERIQGGGGERFEE